MSLQIFYVQCFETLHARRLDFYTVDFLKDIFIFQNTEPCIIRYFFARRLVNGIKKIIKYVCHSYLHASPEKNRPTVIFQDNLLFANIRKYALISCMLHFTGYEKEYPQEGGLPPDSPFRPISVKLMKVI